MVGRFKTNREIHASTRMESTTKEIFRSHTNIHSWRRDTQINFLLDFIESQGLGRQLGAYMENVVKNEQESTDGASTDLDMSEVPRDFTGQPKEEPSALPEDVEKFEHLLSSRDYIECPYCHRTFTMYYYDTQHVPCPEGGS